MSTFLFSQQIPFGFFNAKNAGGCPTSPVVYDYQGNSLINVTVPVECLNMNTVVVVEGAGGGAARMNADVPGGDGGYTKVTFYPTAAVTMNLLIGQGGGQDSDPEPYGGGGDGSDRAGDGGGRSEITVDGVLLGVAGGGGGGGGNDGSTGNGGEGGNGNTLQANGSPGNSGLGVSSAATGGSGGTTSSGGAGGGTAGATGASGTSGTGGNGAWHNCCHGGGGGGGGYYGGGGGGTGNAYSFGDIGRGSGGGGGSGYVNTGHSLYVSHAYDSASSRQGGQIQDEHGDHGRITIYYGTTTPP